MMLVLDWMIVILSVTIAQSERSRTVRGDNPYFTEPPEFQQFFSSDPINIDEIVSDTLFSFILYISAI